MNTNRHKCKYCGTDYHVIYSKKEYICLKCYHNPKRRKEERRKLVDSIKIR